MNFSDKPLYPKQSPIYNKIMQLAIAIVLVVVILVTSLNSYRNNQEAITEHFYAMGQAFLAQSANAVSLLSDGKDAKKLKAYLDITAQNEFVRSIHFYSHTGELMHQSGDAIDIKSLYGVGPYGEAEQDKYAPFVIEVPAGKNQGYMRITLDKEQIEASLNEANAKTDQTQRILLLLAGIVGFLLTRGSSRFSRQGFRAS
ncbi:AhpA/YtjB family protein [Thalassotalea agarivorans]|uniref:Uncharacterized membrane protein affecting hemolysin expression n=1 Tax=Thalassotalea agarivorans TaxID=349064 RepID=A0A1I0ALN8_THASX|nr:AhpA/YtjB family protein [Thalassotalea agarivorans]SES94643.1 Uncharacterized membrane protein affecting hemolysin expression [Thalassotalea agarivorans]